jgi:urea transporter/murein DD-endopeptidase MepM/ murein hydrolase activator NlpD
MAVMLASMLNITAGISGLLAVILAVVVAESLGFDKTQLRQGNLTFNALITGIGLGTFFDPGLVFFALLALSGLMTLMLSVAFSGWLYKYGLPFLSIPFVLTFWLILLPYSTYENLGLTHRNIFWINEMYAVGGNPLINLYQGIESLEINGMVNIYLRSLSSVLFQDNLITGIIIAVALLVSSRILFSLSIVGFLSAYSFAFFTGSENVIVTYYNIGANFMMIAFAIGGFFIIPSKYSYLWTILLVPLTSLVLIFLIKLFGYLQLPVFSLPYAIVAIIFIYFLKLRSKEKSLILTPVQHYSPEKNLYSWLNNKERLNRFLYLPVQLPFWGEWHITQGYDGEYTHIYPRGHAFDFMIFDNDGKTYAGDGFQCQDYYCFGKPITAPADGTVVDIIDHIEDNTIGQVNTIHNWGNTIIIQHYPGVYSQLAHLKQYSVKVKKGAWVKMGEVLAACGNSGRSPYPHLHFQIQSSPNIGSKTISYPISYYLTTGNDHIFQFQIPRKGESISNPVQNPLLYHALNIQPDSTFIYEWKINEEKTCREIWESYTDANNQQYLFSKDTGAIAYYTCDQMMFYFTNFYGSKNSLLYHFFLAAYKISLNRTNITIEDNIPVHLIHDKKWIIKINDFFAPFYNFVKTGYKQNIASQISSVDNPDLKINTWVELKLPGINKSYMQSVININQDGISGFEIVYGKTTISAQKVSL